MCVCVCVFGIHVLKIVVESLKCWLDNWLSCMLDCIHICVFPYWKTVFKQSHFLTAGYLSSFSTSSYRNLDSFSTTRWIDKDFLWILNSFSTAGGSIELLFSLLLNCPSTDPRQLHLSTPFCSTPLNTSIYRALLTFYIKV